MIEPPLIISALEACGISHIIWIPDSYLGTWESAILNSQSIQLIRCSREGEAIALAGGLLLGGAKPLVVIQCTGLFEAGDALRNIVHDLGLPLLAIVGVRGYYAQQRGNLADNCPRFVEPIVTAWQIAQLFFDPEVNTSSDLIAMLRALQRSGKAGIILWAE